MNLLLKVKPLIFFLLLVLQLGGVLYANQQTNKTCLDLINSLTFPVIGQKLSSAPKKLTELPLQIKSAGLIGEGGNGQVFRVQNQDNHVFIVKFY